MMQRFSLRCLHKSLICFVLFLVIEVSTSPRLCNVNITVSLQREFKYKGFHRDISTEYSFMPLEDLMNFSILAIEHLPADVYVNVHDLDQLAEFGGTEVLVLDEIHVEAPAHASLPVDVYMFLNSLDTSMKTILPIHMRYQKAHDCTVKGHFIEISFKLPTVFVRFEDIDLSKCENVIKAPCGVNQGDCSWIPANVISDSPELSLAIPVGCFEQAKFVTALTFLAIAAGLVVLTRVLSNKCEDKDEKNE